MANILLETYKTYVIPHGKIVFRTESHMSMATSFAYPSSLYELPHWKCVLLCFAQCSWIDISSTEKYQQNSNVSPDIFFHVYQHISHCTVHGRHPFNENK